MAKKKGIKFPRVVVSEARHAKLAAEALKKGVHISELVETKLKRADR